ncbi:isopentenyl-diphosphate Delta-isomerase [Candidatus Marsarchaeota archaeon]|jgi:isopentenyl-diphosphate delta-isomerase|nr:isopentenyl-diphosphate Delta-isomerase [Candidatus Marsarchaeota archaeon]
MDNVEVILVDQHDNQIGTSEKIRAHSNGGTLHRAFSVLVLNNKGETMLQRRALTKYHAAGQWSNTVCSHPRPDEKTIDAAHRRLKEEMGFDCELKEVFSFVYKTDAGNNLTEHEYDHVLFGFYDGLPKLNKDEVEEWKWMSLEELKADIAKDPNRYTPWLRLMIDKVIAARKDS